jgi:hypothetical protein
VIAARNPDRNVNGIFEAFWRCESHHVCDAVDDFRAREKHRFSVASSMMGSPAY